MNKKLFFSMFAAAGMLLATSSCSSDEPMAAQSGDEAQVSFSLGLENGMSSRAISDGKSADKLVYAVFDAEGNRISTIEAVTREGVTFPTTETLSLAKGQTYQVAFWAQDASCSAYTVDTDKMSVAVSYASGATNNDETRDAFFKTVTFTVTGSTSIDVELKRPFAQINVGVTTEDWNAAVASGITVEKSSVVIKNAANSLDLLTGKVSGSEEVTYAFGAVPDEELAVDADGDGTKETYKWLSMSYILVADDSGNGAAKATLDGLGFTFKPQSGNNIVFEDGLNSVPVQRNWRTNILGKILTGDITFNISIDPIYDGEYNTFASVSNATELVQALEDPDITRIALNEDMQIGEEVIVTSNKDIDLNGRTLIASEDLEAHENGVLTLTNGRIVQTDGGSIVASTGGSVEIDNVDYDGSGSSNLRSCIFIGDNSQNASVTIRNSNIKGGYYGITSNALANPVATGTFTLENVTVTAVESALMINIPVTVTAKNCTFTGGWQGAFVRGGTYEFTDCAFNLVMDPEYGDVAEDHNNSDGTWSSGNQSVTAALVIGNRGKEGSTSYNYPTSVTLANAKFSVSGTAKTSKTELTADKVPSVYIWSRVEEGNGATFNYDDASETNFKAAGSGLYVGNDGTNLTVNGQPYKAN